MFDGLKDLPGNATLANTEIGSTIYANKPGDGSAREQAASCQRVIGALANITQDYATKRYRSNVINWGMLPFHLKGEPKDFEVGDYIYVRTGSPESPGWGYAGHQGLCGEEGCRPHFPKP